MSEEFPNRSRLVYVERCLEAVAILFQGDNPELDEAILTRAHEKLSRYWEFETRRALTEIEAKAIWSEIHTRLETQNQSVYRFMAVFDKTVNRSPVIKNVIVMIQPLGCAGTISFGLGPDVEWKARYTTQGISLEIDV